MSAGRKATPRALKLVEGRSPGRDSGGRKVKPDPGFVRLPPEPPVWLGVVARAEWERVVPELQRLRLVKPIDAAALTAYCLTWERLVAAQAMIDENGLTHVGSQGLTRHPAVSILESASKDLRSWCAEFGLTPAAEAKVGLKDGGDGSEANPFAG